MALQKPLPLLPHTSVRDYTEPILWITDGDTTMVRTEGYPEERLLITSDIPVRQLVYEGKQSI